jgi:1-acyl-sn-glycerol-3-phosphate acyltransferase
MKRLLNWLSYPRSYIMSPWIAFHTIFMSLVVLTMALLTRNRNFCIKLIRHLWARPALWSVGVKVEVRGRENLPPGSKGFLVLFNHTSLADIPILQGNFPKPLNFGAKIELFRIPIFGPAIAAAGSLKIDRADRKGVMKIYEEAIERVNNGEVFALAPEGTRQTEPVLGRFKRGPFEFAVNAQMNLVPVLVAGALAVLPKDTIWFNRGRWHRRVIMQILPSISTEGLDASHLVELQNKVRASMDSVYSKLNEELRENVENI